MCVTSAISTDWLNRNPPVTWPAPTSPFWPPPTTVTPAPYIQPPGVTIMKDPYEQTPTRAEFNALKNEMEELKKLLLAAKQYDEATGQPNCEMEEKVELITKLAKLVGVDMQEVFNNHK